MSRLYRQVAARIAALIEAGEIGLSDRLPAERHLSTRLSVSRPTIREAIIALELEGLVEVRAGSGVYVVNANSAREIAFDLVDNAGASPLDVINARLDIEPAVARHAAMNASPVQIKGIGATVNAMAAKRTDADEEAADRSFHVVIAEASGNSVLVSIVQTLWSEMASPMFDRLRRVSGLTIQREIDTLAEHQAIYEALANRDADRAAVAMRTHLEHVRAFLQRDWTDAEEALLSLETAG